MLEDSHHSSPSLRTLILTTRTIPTPARQANLNDIIASSLNGAPTFAAGVEFYEARFKKDK